MLTLSRVYLRADQPERGREELEKLALSFFKSMEEASGESFGRLKIRTGVVVQAREGSFVEIISMVVTFGTGLYVAITKFPDFMSGLDSLLKLARKTGVRIRPEAVEQGRIEEDKIQASRVTRGHLMQLKRLHGRVSKGEMSYKDAHEKAVNLFQRAEGEEVSGELSKSLLAFFRDAAKRGKKAPRRPKLAKRPPTAKPRRSRVYRRGVDLERKPGEDEISCHHWP